jgi:putative membrane protein
MKFATQILILLIAVIHVGFLVLEMFLWTRPQGRKIFQTTEGFAKQAKVLAANQGLYNGFLAAGLFWTLFGAFAQTERRHFQMFFLGCIIIAGIYGGMTANKKIFFIQALPALIAFALLYLHR